MARKVGRDIDPENVCITVDGKYFITIYGTDNDAMNSDAIYDLQGRKYTYEQLQKHQLPKGVYIINGVKLVIK